MAIPYRERIESAVATLPGYAESYSPGTEQPFAKFESTIREFAATDLEAAFISADGGFRTDFSGVDGLIAGWAEWMATFDRYEFDVVELAEVPEGVLLLTRQRGWSQGSDVAIESEGGVVYFFDGDLLKRIEFHLGHDAARRAAGVR